MQKCKIAWLIKISARFRSSFTSLLQAGSEGIGDSIYAAKEGRLNRLIADCRMLGCKLRKPPPQARAQRPTRALQWRAALVATASSNHHLYVPGCQVIRSGLVAFRGEDFGCLTLQAREAGVQRMFEADQLPPQRIEATVGIPSIPLEKPV